MTVYYYDNNLGNITSSDGINDFLLGAAPTYYRSLSALINRYVPYYVKHDTLNEWEYGLGQVVNNAGQDVLIRTLIYTSSNNNNKVVFSSGNKTVVATINAERINHGGYNYTDKTSNFVADTVQTIYGVATSTTSITGYLPLASGNKNLLLGFKLKSGSTGNLVIDASGTDTIDGSGFITLTPDTKYVELISDGSGWYELSRELQVTGAGLPSGSIGSIQFKGSATQFAGGTDLFWDSANKHLLIGGNNTSTANVILPASSGQNTIINRSAYDSDFQVKGTGNNQLYFDASTGRIGINTNTPASICHIVGRCANDTLRIESTTQCPTGVALTLYHSPSTGSAVGDYPATINLAGRNGNGQQVNYAQIRSRILGTTIGSTSGEIVLSVDHSGISTNIITANVRKTTIGLSGSAGNNNNILIGNFIKDSGINNISIGHSSSISGATSSNNLLLSHSGTLIGSSSLAGGVNANVSGNNVVSLGANNVVRGSYLSILSNDSNISGVNIIGYGNNNAISGVSMSCVGDNNTVVASTSGIVFGYANSVAVISGSIIGHNVFATGNNLCVVGGSTSVVGSNNYAVGFGTTINGANNNVVGRQNVINGSGSIIIGENNSLVGNSGIVIGRNLTTTSGDNLVLGIATADISIAKTGVIFNSTASTGVAFVVYGSGNNNILYYGDNKLGINKVPTETVDVNGLVRSSGLYSNQFRLGSTATSGSVLVSDASGNAAWQPPSTLQAGLTSNLTPNVLITYNGSSLSSASGLFWNVSGVYTSVSGANNPYIIIPSGNSPMVVNANNSLVSNVFNVRGSGQNNLFNVDALFNRVGVNVGSPAYTVHVSGTSRFFNTDLSFVERNNDQFIVAYDQGISTPNRLEVTSSGLYIRQTTIGTMLPRLTYSSTLTNNGFLSDSVNNLTASEYNYNNSRLLIWDSSDNKVKYSNDIYAGFGAFTGSTDS